MASIHYLNDCSVRKPNTVITPYDGSAFKIMLELGWKFVIQIGDLAILTK